jgi:hypothetical protein
MSTGLSLLLLAAGAILAFAVDYRVSGVEIQTIGLILLVVGIVGLVFSMMFLASFAPFGAHDDRVGGGRTHDHV